jgi:hypothetical protein
VEIVGAAGDAIERDENPARGGQTTMPRHPFWPGRGALVLIVGLLGPGCGEEGDELPRETVWGTVNLDGKPLEKGTIQFTPAPQGSQGAAVQGGGMIESGKYSIPRDRGLVPGEYQVAIFSGRGGRPPVGKNGPVTGGPAPTKETIPAKYNAQSQLKAEIKKGGLNDISFDLTSQ